MIVRVMPFLVPITLFISVALAAVFIRLIAYRERVAMIRHGYVPKGYQPINQQPDQHQAQP